MSSSGIAASPGPSGITLSLATTSAAILPDLQISALTLTTLLPAASIGQTKSRPSASAQNSHSSRLCHLRKADIPGAVWQFAIAPSAEIQVKSARMRLRNIPPPVPCAYLARNAGSRRYGSPVRRLAPRFILGSKQCRPEIPGARQQALRAGARLSIDGRRAIEELAASTGAPVRRNGGPSMYS